MNSKYENTVEVVVAPFIVRKTDGKILLVKSPKWGKGGAYVLPGGHVDPGETLFQTAVREGGEETGLKLKPLYFVNVGERINDPLFNRKAHLIYFHVVCETETSDVKLDGVELNKFFWVTPEEALKLDNLVVRETIENYMRGVSFDIKSEVYK